jgi:Tfp pilus assembly protein PilP
MDKAAEKSASDALAAFEKSDEAIKKKAAEESLAKTLEVIKAYEEALKTKTIPRSVAFTTAGPAFSNYTPATASDRFMLKVGNKEYNTSLDALTKIYDADKAVVEGVTTAQKRLADSLTHLQKTTDKDEEAQSKHKTQLDELNSKMNLDKQYLPQIAALQDRKKIESSIGRSSGDSMVRVGNFLGSAKGAIDSIEQRKVSLLTKIEQNTRPRPMPAHEGSHFAIH